MNQRVAFWTSQWRLVAASGVVDQPVASGIFPPWRYEQISGELVLLVAMWMNQLRRGPMASWRGSSVVGEDRCSSGFHDCLCVGNASIVFCYVNCARGREFQSCVVFASGNETRIKRQVAFAAF